MHPRKRRKESQPQQLTSRTLESRQIEGGAAKKKKHKNSRLKKCRKFGRFLAAMIPIAFQVLMLLIITLAIGLVGKAVGSTFHLLHGAYLAYEVVQRIWQ